MVGILVEIRAGLWVFAVDKQPHRHFDSGCRAVGHLT
jgi:hypothetical protein